MINKENITKWIEALEQQKTPQCMAVLQDTFQTADGTIHTHHCALGIGVMVALENGVKEFFTPQWNDNQMSVWESGVLTQPVIDFYGLDGEIKGDDPVVGRDEDGLPATISELNDAGTKFWDIAQLMRARFLKEEG